MISDTFKELLGTRFGVTDTAWYAAPLDHGPAHVRLCEYCLGAIEASCCEGAVGGAYELGNIGAGVDVGHTLIFGDIRSEPKPFKQFQNFGPFPRRDREDA